MSRIARWVRLCIVCAALLSQAPVQAQGPREQTEAAHEALQSLRLEDAAAALGTLPGSHQNRPEVLYLRGMLAHHRGRYSEAAALLGEAAQAGFELGDGLLDIVQATRDTVANYQRSESDGGRYVVLHPPGREERLLPYAFEALRRADNAISEVLGLRVPGPIRLELYPNSRTLAAVSTLSEEDIERTGTIALCKWDRLMVTSPRALLRGYPWMDTISHELVHLVLARASGNRAPVWLQEGVAKFLEGRWRGEEHALLRPSVAALLARRVRENDLIDFDDLHPSIALLPSQEDAALAFAQVSTFIERYYAEHGAQGLQAAIAAVATGSDARDALAAVAGTSWETLEAAWVRDLRAASTPGSDAPRFLPMNFDVGEGEEDAPTPAEHANPELRRRLRLGNLLWARGRPRAAAQEYRQAHALAPDDPQIASRWGRAALAGGDAEATIAALTPLSERYPYHAPTWAVLAAAHAEQGDAEATRRAAYRAIRLNPFDPAPHCALAQVSAADSGVRLREERQCRALSQPQ